MNWDEVVGIVSRARQKHLNRTVALKMILGQKVELVTQTVGDGLGYDLLSFDDADDSEKLIEAKTTGLGKYFPFCATANEVRCSGDRPEQFHLKPALFRAAI